MDHKSNNKNCRCKHQSQNHNILLSGDDYSCCNTCARLNCTACPPGPMGPRGFIGEPGPVGPIGVTGPVGSTGPEGPMGKMGPRGLKGETGDKGETGAKGETGDKGETGAKGETGDKGATGDRGETGAKGDTGSVSIKSMCEIFNTVNTCYPILTSDFTQLGEILTAPSPVSGEFLGGNPGIVNFATALSADGKTLVVGSPLYNKSAGRAHVAIRTDINGSFSGLVEFTPPSGSTSGYGFSVGISSDGLWIVVAQLSKNAYVYHRSTSNPSVNYDLVSTLSVSGSGSLLGQCGVGVASDGSRVVLGAVGEDTPSTNAGRAYIFRRLNSSGASWVEEAILTPSPPGGDTGDFFGLQVSMSGDGRTAIIGAIFDEPNPPGTGSIYVFERNGANWTQQQYIRGVDLGVDTASSSLFGNANSIGLSEDGLTVAVGAYADDIDGATNDNYGSVYILSRFSYGDYFGGTTGGTGSFQKLVASDGQRSDGFGLYVSLSGSGTTLVVAAGRGKLYLFKRDSAGQYIESQIISQSLSTQTPVAISWDGCTVVAGLPQYDIPSGLTDAGGVIVYRDTTCPAELLMKLGDNLCSVTPEELVCNVLLEAHPQEVNDSPELLAKDYANGEVVTVNAEQVVCGAFNLVEPCYPLLTSDFQQLGEILTAPSPVSGEQLGGYSNAFNFATTISADGKTVVAGSPKYTNNTGRVHVAVRRDVNDQFSQLVELTPPSGLTGGSYFGFSVGISSDGLWIVVEQLSKYAYIYHRQTGYPSSNYDFVATLSVSGSGSNLGQCGVGISSDGSRVVLGAFGEDIPSTDAGRAYVFSRLNNSGASWVEEAILTPSPPGGEVASDFFGLQVSMSGDGRTVMVGAYFDEPKEAGSIYVFERSGSTWMQRQYIRGVDVGVNTASESRFGSANTIGLSEDGLTVAVGAYVDDINGATGDNYGSVYILTRSSYGDYFGGSTGATGAFQRLISSDGQTGDLFGRYVSLSGSGTTLVVSNRLGKLYLFKRDSAGQYIESQIITQGSLSTWTPVTISWDGCTVVAGLPEYDIPSGPTGAGGVIVYRDTTCPAELLMKLGDNLCSVTPEELVCNVLLEAHPQEVNDSPELLAKDYSNGEVVTVNSSQVVCGAFNLASGESNMNMNDMLLIKKPDGNLYTAINCYDEIVVDTQGGILDLAAYKKIWIIMATDTTETDGTFTIADKIRLSRINNQVMIYLPEIQFYTQGDAYVQLVFTSDLTEKYLGSTGYTSSCITIVKEYLTGVLQNTKTCKMDINTRSNSIRIWRDIEKSLFTALSPMIYTYTIDESTISHTIKG